MSAAAGVDVRPFRAGDAEAVAVLVGESAAFHGEGAAAVPAEPVRRVSDVLASA